MSTRVHRRRLLGWPSVAHKIADAVPRGRLSSPAPFERRSSTVRHLSYVCLLDDGTGEIGLLFLGRAASPVWWSVPAAPSKARPEWRTAARGVEPALPHRSSRRLRETKQKEAVEMSEQKAVTYSEGTDEGVSNAAALEDDATDVVEAAGHFRIYLGAAAGVGKTYAMLNEGHRRKQRGTDVVIGFVECHGRPLTQELCDDLEIVPRRVIDYRGTHFEEMDLDAVLARHPKVALIDELAHTNVPGSRPHQALGGRPRASSTPAST